MKVRFLLFVFLVLAEFTQAQITTLDSTTNYLKARLVNFYTARRIQQHVAFYSPVYVRTIESPSIYIPPLDMATIQYRLRSNDYRPKYGNWPNGNMPLYMQSNRYDFISKVKENERH